MKFSGMLTEGEFDEYVRTSFPPIYADCTNCGQRKPDSEFITHDYVCEQCVEDMLKDKKENAFQEALNEMPADFILTFNIVVSIYYEGLEDKKNAGDNVELLCFFAKEAVKEKSKQMKA